MHFSFACASVRMYNALYDVFHAIVMSKQFVCTSMLPLGHLVPQFSVSFPEKLLTIVATRGDWRLFLA